MTASYEQQLRDRWLPEPIADLPEAERIERDYAALEAFATEAVRTLDEHDEANPLKPLPLRELQYLRLFFRLCVSERKIAVPKSRQIMMTWGCFVYVTWRLLRLPYQKWALVPKKKEDGMAHVEDRIKDTIWYTLPPWLKRDYTIAPIKGHFLVTHCRGRPWRSYMTVYPQGADQLRQYTHSGIMWDEAAHQPLMREAWKGAAPTIAGRRGKSGQVLLISSANKGSYFEKLCGDDVKQAVLVARGDADPSELPEAVA